MRQKPLRQQRQQTCLRVCKRQKLYWHSGLILELAANLNKTGVALPTDAAGATDALAQAGKNIMGSNLGAGAIGGLTAQSMQPMEPMDTGRRKINYKKTSAPRDRGTGNRRRYRHGHRSRLWI